MIISSYNNQHGDSVTHTVEFNEHHFPKSYKVSVINLQGKPAASKSATFSGTPKGAAEAAHYYANVISVCEHRNTPAEQ